MQNHTGKLKNIPVGRPLCQDDTLFKYNQKGRQATIPEKTRVSTFTEQIR